MLRKSPELVGTEFREPVSRSEPAARPLLAHETQYLAGDVVGDRYRLVRQIGEGGMGVVWVAHSLVLGVDVALKLIRASVAGPGLSSRMAREAHAAARVGHPALVRVFDFGWTTRGDPYLVMELAQGETVARVLSRERRIGAIRAVQLLLPIADGLRCAHEKGIVHRDIKPENVFIAADPLGRLQPKLLDFGIAKMDQQPSEGKITQLGTVVGSPEYMSPEQALGSQNIDGRTDVWSMCVMLYEMITGETPFRNANHNALIQSILNDPPKPALMAGDAELWRVLVRGLEKSVDKRWAGMAELGEALALWLYQHGVKEDISGNSVRALWLDGTLLRVHPQVTSVPAPQSSSPPVRRRSDVPTQVARLDFVPRARVHLQHYRKQILLVGASLALGVLGTLVISMFTGNDAAPARSALVDTHSEAATQPKPAMTSPPPEDARTKPAESEALAGADRPIESDTPSPPPAAAPVVPANAVRGEASTKPPARVASDNKQKGASARRASKNTIRDFGF